MAQVGESGEVRRQVDLFGEVDQDPNVDDVVAALRAADRDGSRFAALFRGVFDQLYDGQHTGRYRWDQLFKTEKTHFGTLIEIAIRREFADVIGDGQLLDFRIAGHEVDCKFAQEEGSWMVPPECVGQIVLGCWASDERSQWSVGVVRAEERLLRKGRNRDLKRQLSSHAHGEICWLWDRAPMAENVLLHLNPATVARIMTQPSGQLRINELFRSVTRRRIPRGTIATVAQQNDYMRRVRDSGGAREALAPEGYLIAGGFESHRAVARSLGIPEPGEGESVSVQVVRSGGEGPGAVHLRDARGNWDWWRAAAPGELILDPAPLLPDTRRSRAG